MQVNHSPSFTTDSPLDREIKDVLLFDTLNLINFGAVDRKRCIEEERRRVKERLFAKQQDKKELKWEPIISVSIFVPLPVFIFVLVSVLP